MAQAYPNSTFYGFDSHGDSIGVARRRAAKTGANGSLHFRVAKVKDYPDTGFDLICFMDCLHDMGDPVGAARHARQALKADGSVLPVEPATADFLTHNINPVSRLYYAASTAGCTPCSLSQEVRLALGAQAGQRHLSEVLRQAGFNSYTTGSRDTV